MFVLIILMLEVADAGHHHGNSVFVAVFNSVVVANRAAGLNDGGNTCLVRNFYAVGKGEECVGSHNGAVEVEAERTGFGDGLAQGVDA